VIGSDYPLTNQITNLIISDVTVRKTKGTLGGWRPGAGRKPTLRDPVSFTGEVERADMKALEAMAEEKDVSVASLVREALKAFLKRQRRR
jgi:hypothetical protein